MSDDSRDLQAIDAVIGAFYGAFDNRGGKKPSQRDVTEHLHLDAVIVKFAGDSAQLMSPPAFAEPRIELLLSGALAEFHEWETSSATQIMGNMATRQSRYSKHGISSGEPYAGSGQKTFHLIRENDSWKVLSLAWMDHEN